MDKENILGYLGEMRVDMSEGRFIKAYEILKFLLLNIRMDVKKAKVSGTQKTEIQEKKHG